MKRDIFRQACRSDPASILAFRDALFRIPPYPYAWLRSTFCLSCDGLGLCRNAALWAEVSATFLPGWECFKRICPCSPLVPLLDMTISVLQILGAFSLAAFSTGDPPPPLDLPFPASLASFMSELDFLAPETDTDPTSILDPYGHDLDDPVELGSVLSTSSLAPWLDAVWPLLVRWERAVRRIVPFFEQWEETFCNYPNFTRNHWDSYAYVPFWGLECLLEELVALHSGGCTDIHPYEVLTNGAKDFPSAPYLEAISDWRPLDPDDCDYVLKKIIPRDCYAQHLTWLATRVSVVPLEFFGPRNWDTRWYECPHEVFPARLAFLWDCPAFGPAQARLALVYKAAFAPGSFPASLDCTLLAIAARELRFVWVAAVVLA